MTPDSRQIDQNLVRALAHPIRVQILEALQGRTASPTELARRFRESLGVVSYHANALLDVGCIEQVHTRPKRGTIEHFYTARPRSFIGHQDWRRAPRSVRGGVTDEALRTFVAKVGAALDSYLYFNTPNEAALPMLPDALTKLPYYTLTPEVEDRLQIIQDLGEVTRDYERRFTEVKSA